MFAGRPTVSLEKDGWQVLVGLRILSGGIKVNYGEVTHQ